MAEKPLVEPDIAYGAQVVTALDQSSDTEMRPTAALWFLFSDHDVWQLLLALPARKTARPSPSTSGSSMY